MCIVCIVVVMSFWVCFNKLDIIKIEENDINPYDNLNPCIMGMDLWQTAATAWITTYNEFVKNASKTSEYGCNYSILGVKSKKDRRKGR